MKDGKSSVASLRQDRADHLVEAFTTWRDWQSGERKPLDNHSAADMAKDMASLCRQTKAAGTSINTLLTVYAQKHGLLSHEEIEILNKAVGVLNELSSAAGDAKDRVNRSAKRIRAENDAKETASKKAVHRIFSSISVTDAILLLCHLDAPYAVGYSIRELRATRPENVRGERFLRDIQDLQNEAVTVAEWKTRLGMAKPAPGQSIEEIALVTAQSLRSEFESARTGLLSKHANLINHVATCMTAAKLDLNK